MSQSNARGPLRSLKACGLWVFFAVMGCSPHGPGTVLDHYEAVNRLVSKGFALYQKNAFPEALKAYERALEAAGEVNPALSADIHYRIGRVYLKRQQWEPAIQAFERALTLLKKAAEASGKDIVLSNIGIALQQLGLAQAARGRYLEALEIRREIKDRPGEIRSLIDIGSTHLAQGRYTEALDCYEKARAIAAGLTPQDPETAGAVFTHMGALYGELGAHASALAFHHQALGAYEKKRNLEGMATALHNIGYIHAERKEKGDLALAETSFRKALSLRETFQDPFGRADTLNSLGLTLSDAGKPREAVPILEQALEVLEGLGARRHLAATLDSLGSVHHKLGDPDAALSCYGRSLTIWHRIGDRDGERITLGNIGAVMRSVNKPDPAILFYKMAVNISQKIRTEIKALPRAVQRSYGKRVEGFYRELADILVDEGRIAEAEQVLIMLKEEEFFQFMQRSVKGGGQSPIGYTDQERLFVSEYEQARSKTLSAADRTTESVELPADSVPPSDTAQKQERRRFFQFLEELDAAFKSQDREKELGEMELELLRQVQDDLKNLPYGTVLVHTFMTDKRLRMLLTTATGRIPMDSPVSRQEMHRLIREFRELLKDTGKDPLPLARRLHAHLFPPALQRALDDTHARTLLISLDDALRYLPLAALHDGAGYLCERYGIVIFTPAARRHLATPPRPLWKVAGLGVSRAWEPDFDPLAAVPGELDAIVQEEAAEDPVGLYPGVVHIDSLFTLSQLRADFAAGYPVVHIASHFRFRPGSRIDSFLLLGDGRKLNLEDLQLEGFDFSCVDLLTLSACDTASGATDANGREIESFAVLAQQENAKAVLATLWPVADESTARLMADFYRNRKEGLSKVEALRRAQLSFIRGTDRPQQELSATVNGRGAVAVGEQEEGASKSAGPYSHPYYWAPFILMGNFL